MRSLKLVSFLFIAVFLVLGCSSDDDSSGETTNISEDTVAGNYMMTSYNTQNASASFNGIPVNFTVVGENFDYQVNLPQEPNTATTQGTFDAVITTEVLGNMQTETQTISADEFDLSGTWSVNGNQITFSRAGLNEVATVRNATDTTLDLEFDLSEVDLDLQFSGNTDDIDSVEGTLFVTLERI